MLEVFDRLPNEGEEGRHLDGNPDNNYKVVTPLLFDVTQKQIPLSVLSALYAP